MDSNPLFKTLEPWNKGDGLLASRFDEMSRAINALAQRIGAASIHESQQVRVAQFRVYDPTPGDYLICQFWDGITVPEDAAPKVLVAKSPLMRRTPHDSEYACNSGKDPRAGITYTFTDPDPDADPATPIIRTATDEDDATEDQVVIESYEVGDSIFAISNIIGGTGVWVETASSAGGGAPYAPVLWLDLNVDGRKWAVKNE